MSRIYLDHNATTPLAPEVFESMRPWLTEEFGNASSAHGFGQRARAAVEAAREEVAGLLRAAPGEITFTSGGTEADNLALFGAARLRRERGRHLVASAVEHHAVLHALEALQREGFETTLVPVTPQGLVEAGRFLEALRPDTTVAALMLANNEIGTLQPVAELGRELRRRGVVFHTDAVNAVGKVPVDTQALGVDTLALSAHKFYGPKGVGAFYLRKGVQVQPVQYGGEQERALRPGTLNVPGIVGLGAAARLARRELSEVGARLAALRDRLQRGLVERVPGVHVMGAGAPRTPNTLDCCFEGVHGETLILTLDMQGIAVSSGAACAAGSTDPSHVLAAMGVPAELAQSAVRMSLGRGTTEAEVDRVLEALPAAVQRLRRLAPGAAGPAR
ncbi:MAG TPA: cysteine desulfurase family protein [Candidatus Saccharimonadales bacterium]|nr:cysteine desulfurase family protein [Candidatus Saccharimonadales bacterium]